MKGHQGRNLGSGTGAKAMEEAADWLASHDLLNLISYRAQDHLPRSGTIHNGPGLLTLITN